MAHLLDKCRELIPCFDEADIIHRSPSPLSLSASRPSPCAGRSPGRDNFTAQAHCPSSSSLLLLPGAQLRGRNPSPNSNLYSPSCGCSLAHSFAGVRAKNSTGDWVVKPMDSRPSFVHAAGVDSPGLAGSPAIALEVSPPLPLRRPYPNPLGPAQGRNPWFPLRAGAPAPLPTWELDVCPECPRGGLREMRQEIRGLFQGYGCWKLVGCSGLF